MTGQPPPSAEDEERASAYSLADEDRCPECDGAGELYINPQRDASTGVWTHDERECPRCSGTGSIGPEPADLIDNWINRRTTTP